MKLNNKIAEWTIGIISFILFIWLWFYLYLNHEFFRAIWLLITWMEAGPFD